MYYKYQVKVIALSLIFHHLAELTSYEFHPVIKKICNLPRKG